ncbi:hypothetical protein BGZ70_002316 [Mortierella alpina]|uniref:Transmembrane protein 198 n=1 Tax=Mortierella alpina TaxID=64518 RepID=A0A9P6LW60_MORAP|nr:hypothetical protein BGZ70_002316 [Mortierella alpina]
MAAARNRARGYLIPLAFAGCVLLAWCQLALASPLPQSPSTGLEVGNRASYPANDSSLEDPFSTPDYLAPSKFTWANCIYGLLFLFFGAIEVLHGYKYIRFTMLVAGFLVWASAAVMIMLIVDISSGNYQTSGVYFAVWFIVGFIGSLVSFYFWHVGIVLTGAYGMFVLVAIVFTAVNLQNYVLRYTVLALCLVLGGVLTYKFERISVILSTSIGGAYSMMFGLDMFVQTGFRATFHVILSQSTARFHPVLGTWIMIGAVPVIAIVGIVYELWRHEEPVAGWWFGHGARPLPPVPGEDNSKRRCCGLVRSRPPPKTVPGAIIVIPSKKEKRRCCCGGGGGEKSAATTTKTTTTTKATVVAKASTSKKTTTTIGAGAAAGTGGGKSEGGGSSSICCVVLCCGQRRKRSTNKTVTFASAGASASAGGAGAGASAHASASAGVSTGARPPSRPASPMPFEKAHFGPGHETIGHTEHHKIVIQKKIREYSMEIDERW